MSEKNILNVETLVEAIKEVAEVIAKNGGADIRAVVKETDNVMQARIIIEPYRFIAEREEATK